MMHRIITGKQVRAYKQPVLKKNELPPQFGPPAKKTPFVKPNTGFGNSGYLEDLLYLDNVSGNKENPVLKDPRLCNNMKNSVQRMMTINSALLNRHNAPLNEMEPNIVPGVNSKEKASPVQVLLKDADKEDTVKKNNNHNMTFLNDEEGANIRNLRLFDELELLLEDSDVDIQINVKQISYDPSPKEEEKNENQMAIELPRGKSSNSISDSDKENQQDIRKESITIVTAVVCEDNGQDMEEESHQIVRVVVPNGIDSNDEEPCERNNERTGSDEWKTKFKNRIDFVISQAMEKKKAKQDISKQGKGLNDDNDGDKYDVPSQIEYTFGGSKRSFERIPVSNSQEETREKSELDLLVEKPDNKDFNMDKILANIFGDNNKPKQNSNAQREEIQNENSTGQKNTGVINKEGEITAGTGVKFPIVIDASQQQKPANVPKSVGGTVKEVKTNLPSTTLQGKERICQSQELMRKKLIKPTKNRKEYQKLNVVFSRNPVPKEVVIPLDRECDSANPAYKLKKPEVQQQQQQAPDKEKPMPNKTVQICNEPEIISVSEDEIILHRKLPPRPFHAVHERRSFTDVEDADIIESEASSAKKGYSLYEDWRLIETIEAHIRRKGEQGLKSKATWAAIKDPRTGKRVLDDTRSGESMRNRVRRTLNVLSEEDKNEIKRFMITHTEEEARNYYIKFDTGGSSKKFAGILRIPAYQKESFWKINQGKSSVQSVNEITAENGRPSVDDDIEEEEEVYHENVLDHALLRLQRIQEEQEDLEEDIEDEEEQAADSGPEPGNIIDSPTFSQKCFKPQKKYFVANDIRQNNDEVRSELVVVEPVFEENTKGTKKRKEMLKDCETADDNSAILKKVKLNGYYQEKSLTVNCKFRMRKSEYQDPETTSNILVLVDLEEGFRQFIKDTADEKEKISDPKKRLEYLAEKYGIGMDDLKVLFNQVSCYFDDLEKYLETKNQNILWKQLEDEDVIAENKTALRYLSESKGEASIHRRKMFLLDHNL